MFENTPTAYCPVCGERVPAACMKYSGISDGMCTEVYVCGLCGTRFHVDTGLLSEVN